MYSLLKSLFSSPERLLSVMSRRDMQEEKDDGERILIDEDGGASVNICSPEVHEDFARHVETLRHAGDVSSLNLAGKKTVVEQDVLKKYPAN